MVRVSKSWWTVINWIHRYPNQSGVKWSFRGQKWSSHLKATFNLVSKQGFFLLLSFVCLSLTSYRLLFSPDLHCTYEMYTEPLKVSWTHKQAKKWWTNWQTNWQITDKPNTQNLLRMRTRGNYLMPTYTYAQHINCFTNDIETAGTSCFCGGLALARPNYVYSSFFLLFKLYRTIFTQG